MANHQPPQLFLIDGYALIYRAFFAMITRPLRTSKGENTSAAWGVVNFLLRLREKYRPDYVAWVNDAGTSFRTERYAEYKSTREKLDEELQADFDRAIERIASMLGAFRIPLVAVPGYEADDVIGTLATQASDRGLRSVIVSGDKDFYQLISPGVVLLNPGRGGPAAVEETWVDEANADERLGVPPRQVVDFLALVGDSSDNVPGVRGIGEKGAQKLLADYGDLENLLAHAAEVTAKRSREALLAQADNARLSRELVTIRRDVPVQLDVGDLVLKEPDRDAVIRLLSELEFFTLVKRLGASPDGQSGPRAAARPVEVVPAADGAGEQAGERPISAGRLARPRRSAGRRRDRRGRSRRDSRAGSASPRGADRRARHRDLFDRPARRRARRPLPRREPDRGVVSPLRSPPALRRARRAAPGEKPPGSPRSRARAARRAAHRSGRSEGGPQHQVRLAGPARGGGGARGRGVRLDARELRARSGPSLSRHRQPEPRASRARDAGVR